jgi:hypothetical protein
VRDWPPRDWKRATGEHTHGDGAMFEPLMRARSAPVGDAEETRRAAAASRGEKADVRRPRSEERGHTRLKRVISCDRKPIGAVDSGHAIAMWLVGMCRACTCEQKFI